VIKKEKDIFKKDLTTKANSYAYYLNQKIQDIYSMFENSSVSVDQYKEFIRRVIADAKDTDAKRNFLLTLQRQRTKTDVLTYANNALMKGQGLEAI